MEAITKESLIERMRAYLYSESGHSFDRASTVELYHALSKSIKEVIGADWTNTYDKHYGQKVVYNLSFEYLPGKFLEKNLRYMDLWSIAKEAIQSIGYDFEEILKEEEDQSIGNGSLGRLSYALMDSSASQGINTFAYGLRYEKGLMKQTIVDCHQVENPDNWLAKGNPWEYRRTITYPVHFRDYTVKAVAYDVPIVGYRNHIVNTLRLWSSESTKDIDFQSFSRGDIYNSYEDILRAKSIVDFLYPDDTSSIGKQMRIYQEYFYVSASLQDIIYRHVSSGMHNITNGEDIWKVNYLWNIDEKISIQLNDTHPVFAIPEMIYLLTEKAGFDMETAVDKCKKIFHYTNHSVLAESMERWNLDLIKTSVPHLADIILKLDLVFRDEIKQLPNPFTDEEIKDISLIENGQVKLVSMAIWCSSSVSGISESHTTILKTKEFNNYYKAFGYKFNNKPGGIIHRTWLMVSNPNLSDLIASLIGNDFMCQPEKLISLKNFIEDETVLNKLAKLKHQAKVRLADVIYSSHGVIVNPYSIFDMQLKNFHEYKRQLLNGLHIAFLYFRLKDNANLDIPARTFFFSGKSAPGYYISKEIISFLNHLALMINKDRTIKDKLKVIFVENYKVSKAELLIPCCDVSEQISTPGKEASGTSAMKFMLNGAIAIASRDGANLQIRNVVGEENIFMFGQSITDVYDQYEYNYYNPEAYVRDHHEIRSLIDRLHAISWNGFHYDFNNIYRLLMKYNDSFMVLRDFIDYTSTQDLLSKRFMEQTKWQQMSLTNIAHAGCFSYDQTIADYAKTLWKVPQGAS